MSIEQVAMAMWAGSLLDLYQPVVDWNDAWQVLPAESRQIWRGRARQYLRALGKIK